MTTCSRTCRPASNRVAATTRFTAHSPPNQRRKFVQASAANGRRRGACRRPPGEPARSRLPPGSLALESAFGSHRVAVDLAEDRLERLLVGADPGVGIGDLRQQLDEPIGHAGGRREVGAQDRAGRKVLDVAKRRSKRHPRHLPDAAIAATRRAGRTALWRPRGGGQGPSRRGWKRRCDRCRAGCPGSRPPDHRRADP